MKTSKLSVTLLKSVSIRVLIVIFISSVVSYIHLYQTISHGAKETLQKYVGERVKREEELFLLAQENHTILKKEIIERFNQRPILSNIIKFDQLLRRLPDGTIRNKKELYDGTKSAGVFIPPGVKITDQLKHQIVVMMELTESYGKAFRSRFQDTYFTTSDNIMVLFWPEVPNWTMEMKADFNMLKEEYVWIADKKNNPSRSSVWTGVFYDKIGKTWMTSLETPVDGNNWSVTIGHDVMLDDFVTRVSSEHLDGTYNMIFRNDGNLITHPVLLSDIKQSEGKLNLKTTNNNLLKKIFMRVTSFPNEKIPSTKVIQIEGQKDLFAFSKIRGPGWFFVTVFPHTLITSVALNGIFFIIILALVSLLFEIVFLYFGLKRDVIKPLKDLEASVKKISQGEYHVRVENDRTDELGHLAKSFNKMANQIYDNEKSLIQKVEERTKIVDEQRVVLIQKSKLASLGLMAGGIAHEINTPLAIISMELEQLHESVEDNSATPEDIKESIKTVQSTTERIAKIIKGLNFFARDGKSLPIESAHLSTIIVETLSFCSEKMRLNDIRLEIVKHYDESLYIDCRSVEISQVLLNLLNNSIDAISEQSDKWIKIVVNDNDPNIEINIIDSGNGIPMDIQEKIMQPFFTTKDLGKGTGLGLSISLGIIHSHQGKIFIDNDSSNTKFTIILPKKHGKKDEN